MNTPIISIIVPVYKSERYLPRCIESIINQEFKDIELILVNDGSPDNSGQICDRYALKDNRIKVIHKINGGVSSARNSGIEVAKGKYIMFADSDDYVESNWCYIMYNSIINNPESIILSGYFIENHINNTKEAINISTSKGTIKFRQNRIWELYEKNFLNTLWNKIFILDLIKEKNIKFDTKLELGEDLLFNLEYMKYINKDIVFINENTYNYIIRDRESLHTKYYVDFFHISNKIFSKLEEFMKIKNVNLKEYEGSFYNAYLYMLNLGLKNTFNEKNTDSFIKKIKYNSKLMRSIEFNKCIKSANYNGFDKRYIDVLKTKNYIFVYILERLIYIKRCLNN